MKQNSSPLSSLVLLLAVSLPLAAADGPSYVECVGEVAYVANSTYQANLRRLAAVLPAEVSVAGGPYRYRAIGYWPNRLQASTICRRRDDSGTVIAGYSSCATCIAGAFLEVESACPYRREAFFHNRNCTLQLSELRIFGTDGIYEGNIWKHALASGLIFQAIGFAWLFFLLLQEWRDRKKGTMMRSSPLLSGD